MDQKSDGNNTFSIELGDILQIISPTNSDLNDQAFYVSYVDSSKIKLININTYTLAQLILDENGTITDESIKEIHLLTRSSDPGFARQNNLLPKTWIDIHFGGEMPYIATGEITNLEEDMIEIKTVDNTVFYIDFEYKGLPENIPIDKIIIRDPPANAAYTSRVEMVEPAIRVSVSPDESVASIEYTENGESIIHVPEGTVPDTLVQDVLHEIYLDANELYGQDLEEVFQMIEIPEHQKKYTIETQVNDFMDELLSTIPNSKRTSEVMAKIHNLVERFKELRNMYSVFDENGNVIGKKTYGDLYKPLLEHIFHLDTRLRWLIPAVRQTRKIYLSKEEEEEPLLNETDDLMDMDNLFTNYYKNTTIGNELKYDTLYSKLNPYMTPFVPPTNSDLLLSFKQEVVKDLDAIVNNSNKINDAQLSRFKYMIQRYNIGMERPSSTELKGGMKVSLKTQITPPDKISVQSLFMLPYSVVKYSHVDLPATNIMIRSQLSQNHLDFFRLFHKSSQFAVRFISNLDKEIDYGNGDDSDITFLNKTTEYILDDSLQSEEDKYRKFLNVIIPKTRYLIKLMQKYHPSKMSLVDVVSTLEPFMIYPNNLTYGQYNEIRYHIKQQINEYKKNMVKNSRDFKVFPNKTSKHLFI